MAKEKEKESRHRTKNLPLQFSGSAGLVSFDVRDERIIRRRAPVMVAVAAVAVVPVVAVAVALVKPALTRSMEEEKGTEVEVEEGVVSGAQ
jgi:hypothetical protein